MTELAKAMQTFALQAEVRRSMRHVGGFPVETDLPKPLSDKLDELDRAAALQAGRSS